MPRLTGDEMVELLAEPGHLARIATVDDDGMPRVLPLWFVLQGTLVCFTPRSPAVIWANLQRDARVGISIDEEVAPYRKVTVQGVAEVLHPPGDDAAWRDLYVELASRYIPRPIAESYVEATADQPRALCAVDLEAPATRVSTWRMPIAGEDPAGIWHRRYYLPGTRLAERDEP